MFRNIFALGLCVLAGLAIIGSFSLGSEVFFIPNNRFCAGSWNGKTAVLIGDSLAEGLKNHLGDLVRKKNGRFLSSTVGGTTVEYWTGGRTADYLLRVEALDGRRPAIVFVSLGVNDLFSGAIAGSKVFNDSVRGLLSEIGESSKIIWIGPPRWPPVDGKKAEVKSAAAAIVGNFKGNEIYFDSRLLELKNTNRKDGDGHPAPAAYEHWADEIWKWCGGLL